MSANQTEFAPPVDLSEAIAMVADHVAKVQRSLSRALAVPLSEEHPQDTVNKAMNVAEKMAALGALQELHFAMTLTYAPGAKGS